MVVDGVHTFDGSESLVGVVIKLLGDQLAMIIRRAAWTLFLIWALLRLGMTLSVSVWHF